MLQFNSLNCRGLADMQVSVMGWLTVRSLASSGSLLNLKPLVEHIVFADLAGFHGAVVQFRQNYFGCRLVVVAPLSLL